MRLILRFEGQRSSHEFIADVLAIIGQRAYESEILALTELAREVPEISPETLERVFDRLPDYRYEALQVETARPGSIELVLAGTALAYWILEKTVGEDLTESWKKTGLSKKIREFFLFGSRRRARRLAERLERDLRSEENPRVSRRLLDVKVEAREDGERIVIHVVERKHGVPTYDDLDRPGDA